MKGFTLIELLVSVALFTVVMVVALGALLAIAESDRKAQTLKTITNNLGFALDSMSRTIRTGADYSCETWDTWSVGEDHDCSGETGGTLFTFSPVCAPGGPCPPERVGFRYNADLGECGNTGDTGGCIERSEDGGSTWEVITAPEVVIENLTFYLHGSPQDDGIQPRLTITTVGHVKITETLSSRFRIQTAVTQRLYDQ